MQGGGRGVHGAGELGLIANITAKVDGVLIDTRENSPGSLILEIWDKSYQQVRSVYFKKSHVLLRPTGQYFDAFSNG